MSRVDFYILSDESSDARLRCACRLAEKAVDQGLRIYIQSASVAESQRLDELLWTFSDRSFLAHEVIGNGAPTHSKVMVLLGEADAPDSHRQLLINMTDRLPASIAAFDRVIEIVDTDPERKRLSRDRYKQYRERGCTLDTHNL